MTNPTINITPLPILASNYLWLIRQDLHVWAVDPGDSVELCKYIKSEGLKLKGVLITHSHNDHVGGLEYLLQAYQVPVYAPRHPKIEALAASFFRAVDEGDKLQLFEGVEACVWHVPGHLDEHVAFIVNEADSDIDKKAAGPHLFCGDTLFSAGCGRMFAGPAELYLSSLLRLAALPDATKVYCAHEYTLANLEWALSLLPADAALLDKKRRVQDLLDKGLASLPSTIRDEKQANLFLRTDEKALRQILSKWHKLQLNSADEYFSVLRQHKDHWA
ncbi:hydroxyacylglutathione hydrolase [Agaribacterium sp. ZY112]|uniref:hydroxyacylglutathione hydrolase n=1 Tax=Agaribacterium sp. ZY112 TaxID=3233574 RepID=UPI0035256E69